MIWCTELLADVYPSTADIPALQCMVDPANLTFVIDRPRLVSAMASLAGTFLSSPHALPAMTAWADMHMQVCMPSGLPNTPNLCLLSRGSCAKRWSVHCQSQDRN